jgi:hypothetical protein
MFYHEDAKSSAVAAAGDVIMPNGPWQRELEISVKMRMSKVMGNINWFGYDQERLIAQLYDKVAQMLINSELTSNIPTPKMWAILASAGQMKNMWAQGKDTSTKYGAERNAGEKAMFGSLSGDSDNPTGEGRPFYIALNPGCLQQGAAPYYGRSYIVYKAAVKMRCTFTATDSLQMLKQTTQIALTDVCSLSTIANILLRVSDRQLHYLCSIANGTEADSPNEFIEAQGWGSINLASDVEIIVISDNDLVCMQTDNRTDADNMPPELINMTKQERRLAIDTMLQTLKSFCSRHGISLVRLPLGPDTMNSRETRPF